MCEKRDNTAGCRVLNLRSPKPRAEGSSPSAPAIAAADAAALLYSGV